MSEFLSDIHYGRCPPHQSSHNLLGHLGQAMNADARYGSIRESPDAARPLRAAAIESSPFSLPSGGLELTTDAESVLPRLLGEETMGTELQPERFLPRVLFSAAVCFVLLFQLATIVVRFSSMHFDSPTRYAKDDSRWDSGSPPPALPSSPIAPQPALPPLLPILPPPRHPPPPPPPSLLPLPPPIPHVPPPASPSPSHPPPPRRFIVPEYSALGHGRPGGSP